MKKGTAMSETQRTQKLASKKKSLGLKRVTAWVLETDGSIERIKDIEMISQINAGWLNVNKCR